jgi:hypothetical protein
MLPSLLQEARDALEAAGRPTSIVQVAGADDQLQVSLEDDARGHAQGLLLTVYPGMAELDDTELVQFLVVLPFTVGERARADLARLLHALNMKWPAQGFALRERDGMVLFRHVAVAPRAGGPGWRATVLELATLIEFQIEASLPVVEAIATGAIGYDEALDFQPDLRLRD